MERDFGKEIDEIKNEVELLKIGRGKPEDLSKFLGITDDQLNERNDEMKSEGKQFPEWGFNLANDANEKGYKEGIVKFSGIFNSPVDEGHMWNLEDPISDLLSMNGEIIEKVLSAIGNRVRIQMLKDFLCSPASAAEIVQKLGLKTTGKAYHHLNILEKADLIYKDDEGKYHMRGHRVSGFFAALLAVKNTADERFTSGCISELPPI